MSKMTKITASLMIGASLLMAGCVTDAKYAAVQQVIKGSPAVKPELIDKCVRSDRSSAETKRMLGMIMNLKPGADAVRVGCARIVNAVGSGRISYQDYRAAVAGSPTVDTIRVLQGR